MLRKNSSDNAQKHAWANAKKITAELNAQKNTR
jgi:hypothetical protein